MSGVPFRRAIARRPDPWALAAAAAGVCLREVNVLKFFPRTQYLTAQPRCGFTRQ
jgi:hypothetical protein